MIGPWRFFRKYLDLEFGTSRGTLRVRIVERPGLWLSPERLTALVADLRHVVRSLDIGALDYGVLSGEKQRLDRAVLTLIYDAETGEPVAFNALAYLDCTLRGRPVEVVHLGLVSVNPAYRERGVAWILTGFTTFLLFVKHGLQPYWISNVSQVPSAIGMVCEACSNTFPSPDPGARRTFDHLTLAREIMARHRGVFGVGPDAGFDEQRLVITNAYTGGSDNLKKTFDEAPPHRLERYNAFCASQLDYARGDDFLQLGQVTLLTLWRYLAHALPRDRFWTATSKFAFVAVNALLLPVLQWLTPSQPMDDLRARGKAAR